MATPYTIVAAWIAQLAFWALLLLGATFRELSVKSVGLFLILWVVACVGVPRISSFWGLFVTPYIAVLDIVLVFVVLKGDVWL